MKKYYPSNSSDGDGFEAKNCENCYKHSQCTILINAYFGKHPKQWVYNDKDEAVCTSKQENRPKPKRKRMSEKLPKLF